MITINEEKVRKLIYSWTDAASKIASMGESANPYQQGMAYAYNFAALSLREQLQNSEAKFRQQQTEQALDETSRSADFTIVTSTLAVLVITSIPLLLLIGAFRSIAFTFPFVFTILWIISAAHRWRTKKTITLPLISVLIGLCFVIFSGWGSDFVSGLAQALSIIGGQLMGAALIGGLILWIKKRKNWESISMALVIFGAGLITVLLFNTSLINVTFPALIKSLFGIFGFEILGAGITVVFIGGWIEE